LLILIKMLYNHFQKKLYKKLKEWRDHIDSLSLSLEIVTNLTATDEELIQMNDEPYTDFVSPLHPSIVQHIDRILKSDRVKIYFTNL